MTFHPGFFLLNCLAGHPPVCVPFKGASNWIEYSGVDEVPISRQSLESFAQSPIGFVFVEINESRNLHGNFLYPLCVCEDEFVILMLLSVLHSYTSLLLSLTMKMNRNNARRKIMLKGEE